MKDYTGRRFGFWKVVSFHGVRGGKNRYWEVQCRCGNRRTVPIQHLKNGRSKSCGCGVNKIANTKHGLAGTKIYKTWDGMKERCLNPRNPSYGSYGGRGITICAFLLQSPSSIISVIGDHPGKGWSIDRINVNGHYSCGECPQCYKDNWITNIRWATPKQQCRNRRNNRIIYIDGRVLTSAEVAEIAGVTNGAIHCRLKRGETGGILLAPSHERKKIVDQHATLLSP